jgi:hypothetical protein
MIQSANTEFLEDIAAELIEVRSTKNGKHLEPVYSQKEDVISYLLLFSTVRVQLIGSRSG